MNLKTRNRIQIQRSQTNHFILWKIILHSLDVICILQNVTTFWFSFKYMTLNVFYVIYEFKFDLKLYHFCKTSNFFYI